jgi:hypothetical protein
MAERRGEGRQIWGNNMPLIAVESASPDFSKDTIIEIFRLGLDFAIYGQQRAGFAFSGAHVDESISGLKQRDGKRGQTWATRISRRWQTFGLVTSTEDIGNSNAKAKMNSKLGFALEFWWWWYPRWFYVESSID